MSVRLLDFFFKLFDICSRERNLELRKISHRANIDRMQQSNINKTANQHLILHLLIILSH